MNVKEIKNTKQCGSVVQYHNTKLDKRTKENPFRLVGLQDSSPSLLDRIAISLGLKHPDIYEWVDYNIFKPVTRAVPTSLYSKNKIAPSVMEKKYCGSRKKLLPDNPEYQKIQALHKKAKIYAIEHDGGCPYIVYKKGSEIWVYQPPNDHYYIPRKERSGIFLDDRWIYIQLTLHIKNVLNLWIDKKYPNSMLIQTTNPTTFIFIGEVIYSFTLPSSTRIIEYHSPMIGNSPYPYAIDKDGFAYLLIAKTRILFDKKKSNDPYQLYYMNKQLGQSLKNIRNK